MELLTPWGRGGVAVLRAAPHEREALFATLRTAGGGSIELFAGDPPRRAVWRLPGGIEDDVLVVDRGVDGVEVHAHGSPVVLESAASAFGPLRDPQCAPAQRLLRSALSREQVALALEQSQHGFESWLEDLHRHPAQRRRAAAEAALARSRAAMAMSTPARLVLTGRQNAGKSTLFNRLVFCERSLTGPTAGLTRDAVAEHCCLAGYPYEIVDTAGEADSPSGIDAAALVQAREHRRTADVLVLLVDGSAAPQAIDLEIAAAGAIVVATKADLAPADWGRGLLPLARFAASDPASAPTIRIQMGEILRTWRCLPPAGPVGGPAALSTEQWQALRMAASAADPSSA